MTTALPPRPPVAAPLATTAAAPADPVEQAVAAAAARFWSHVDRSAPDAGGALACWRWTRPRPTYDLVAGVATAVERIAVELTTGEDLASVLLIRRTDVCPSDRCVRPEHYRRVAYQPGHSRGRRPVGVLATLRARLAERLGTGAGRRPLTVRTPAPPPAPPLAPPPARSPERAPVAFTAAARLALLNRPGVLLRVFAGGATLIIAGEDGEATRTYLEDTTDAAVDRALAAESPEPARRP